MYEVLYLQEDFWKSFLDLGGPLFFNSSINKFGIKFTKFPGFAKSGKREHKNPPGCTILESWVVKNYEWWIVWKSFTKAQNLCIS